MRKFVAIAILVPLAIVIVMFAVANREIITVSFDPFDSAHPAFALKMPLFMLIFVLVGARRRGRRHRGLAEAAQVADASAARRSRGARAARAARRAALRSRNRAGRWRRRRRSSSRRRRAHDHRRPWSRRPLRIVTADELDRVLTLRRADRRAGRGVPLRHHRAGQDRPLHPAAVGQRCQGAADAGLEQFRRALHRLQADQCVSRQRQAAASRRCSGSYVLMSGDTGETLAVMDGAALTAWRTAAASALAARYLAREDASHLVMVGAGALAPHLVRAHRAVRPIKRVTLVEPHALARDLDRVRAVGRRHRAGHRRRSGGGGARGRHRVLRDAVARSRWSAAPGSRRAPMSIWSARSRSRPARPTTRRSPRPRLCR